MAYVSAITPDHTFDPQYFAPVFRDVCCGWIPDLSGGWGVDYDAEGLAGLNQTWIVPRHEKLPLLLRQMLSWNRDLYSQYFQIRDWNPTASPAYFDRPLVPVSARLTPLPTNNSPEFIANHFQTVFSNKVASGSDQCGTCDYNIFPSIYTDKYRLDVQWARDEFTNRFGIKYAKVEVEPSIRLESISGSSMGVVKIDSNGAPILEPPGGANPVVEKLTTGFPAREPQILIKVTFPWVSLKSANLVDIVRAGPIGNTPETPVGPGVIPAGQLLGTINEEPFLGFPTGRALYQSASLVEKVSPVTGRLGYQVTHDFLCLSSADWNTTRIKGGFEDTDIPGALNADQATAAWPYGYIVGVDQSGVITLKAGQPIYPYAYTNLEKLFYYGGTSDTAPVDEA